MSGNPSPAQLNRVLQGLSANRFTRGSRLPTLRSPRDLTLGGRGTPRRVIAPNIPVKRERSEDNNSANNESPAKQMRGGGGPGRRGRGDRGRGRGDRGRGRGRGRGGVVQLESTLFGEGLSLKMQKGRMGGNTSGESSYIQKPKVSFDFSVEDDDGEAERLLKLATRDDFIDNDDYLEYVSACELPVSLPMMSKQLFSVKEEVVDECETKVKLENQEQVKLESETEVKIKDEPLDYDDAATTDLKNVKIKEEPTSTPTDTEMTDVKKEIKKEKKSVELNVKINPTVGDVLEKAKESSSRGHEELFLIQLPRPLPGIRRLQDDIKPKIKQEPGTTSRASVSNDNSNMANSEKTTGATLNDISEGHIGKIYVRKSRKSMITFGDLAMDFLIGNEKAFLQDLISFRVQDDESIGRMSCIGHTEHTLVCIPKVNEGERKN